MEGERCCRGGRSAAASWDENGTTGPCTSMADSIMLQPACVMMMCVCDESQFSRQPFLACCVLRADGIARSCIAVMQESSLRATQCHVHTSCNVPCPRIIPRRLASCFWSLSLRSYTVSAPLKHAQACKLSTHHACQSTHSAFLVRCIGGTAFSVCAPSLAMCVRAPTPTARGVSGSPSPGLQ